MAANILIKEFIKDFEVGAIAPTSNNLAKKVIEKLTFEKEAIIIEYGPGDGVITKMLLDKMTTNSVLYVFETNKTFIKKLIEIKDNRLIIINDNASKARLVLKNCYNVEKVDYIISTIPFSFIKKNKRRRIISVSYKILKEQGKFITYQYSFFIFHLLKTKFKNVNWEFILLNIPPAFIINGIKMNTQNKLSDQVCKN